MKYISYGHKARRLDALVRFARIHKHPTTGKFALMVWDLFSSDGIFSFDFAKQMYLKLGYKPFAGYPLERI